MIDLEPAAAAVTSVVSGVPDERLAGPTPCPDYSVAAMLDHLLGLAWAFTQSARKADLGGPGGAGSAPRPSAGHLPADWRGLLPGQLAGLAAAWADPAAWQGTASAGGATLPAEIMGVVALNELVVHGWDLARATGQPYRPDEASLAACRAMLAPTVDHPEQRDGIYGPVVAVPPAAPLLDQVVGLAGRHPGWTPVSPS
jgi:uncharacterized protein (TIGR03086 family)